jgi:hypothetical protein
MSQTPVVVKFPAESRVTNIDFALVLVGGELITGQSVATSSPAGLTVSVSAAVGSAVPLTTGGGADLQSYGVDVTVTTDQAHTYTIRVAVVNNSNIAANYQNTNVDTFATLIDEIEAGEAALGQAAFTFPAGFDAAGGQVKWELVDANGVVLSSGQSFDYAFSNVAGGVKVEAQAVVNVPSDAIPTLQGQAYQIRWTLMLNGQSYYSFENIKVVGPATVPVGVEDVVELAGNDVPVSCVFQQAFDTVSVIVYQNNIALSGSVPVPPPLKTADGWLYTVTLTGLPIEAALEPYTLIWSAKNNANPYTERQTGRLFMVNPSILTATDDMRLLVNRSRTTIAHAEDILFTVPLLLAYLRRGRDAFNGAYGVPTNFSMHDARGPIREYWLRFSEIMALRGQYLAESEKVFNFSGQAIQLDVDRTQYYDQMANTLQQLMDNECKPFKTMLIKRGILGGDGNADPTRQRPGATGAIGITITPASNFGPYARYRR